MVAPDERLNMYDNNKPSDVKIIPITVESIIKLLISLVYCLAIAAGMAKSAITSITPTTLIRTTTLRATKLKRRIYINSEGIPNTFEYSSSNAIDKNSL